MAQTVEQHLPAQRPADQEEQQLPSSAHQRARRLAWGRLLPVVALFAAAAAPAVRGEVSFDLNNCNTSAPCCVSGDDTTVQLGTLTKSFCKIEYPIRMTKNWNSTSARILDRKAQLSLDLLTARGCELEACKGFVCAEYFPRCFYVDDSTQGSFVFETCRETCEACYSTCTVDESPKCGGKPSQYEIACTSDSTPLHVSRLLLGALVLVCMRLVLL